MALQPIPLGNLSCTTPFFLAPMAGITHSAFRRLIAHFGGYGALYTEMVPPHTLISENCATSSLTKRRSEEGAVIYQMVITGSGSVDVAAKNLVALEPFAIDINLGCPAPMISRKGGGKALYDDIDRLRHILETVRRHWMGPLMVKCRLGHEKPDWQEQFLRRIELFKSVGVDALTVHPRFFHEKLKRQARWHYFPWIKTHWEGTLIGNGDMVDRRALELLTPGSCDGLMIGRGAIRKPWFFRELCGDTVQIDYKTIWNMLYEFTREDFTDSRALGRMKEFTSHFALNFFFGHELFTVSQGAVSCEELYARVNAFLAADPRVSL